MGAPAGAVGRYQALTPDLLHRLEIALFRTDLSSLLRRHAVCRIGDEAPPETRFVEWTVSIADLAEMTVPDFDLTSDPWLFQHLTETLDRRMLAMMARPDQTGGKDGISINLNVSTLLSEQFFAFDEMLAAARRGGIVVELKLPDIVHDVATFVFARDLVHKRGYRLCLDGLTLATVDLVDRSALGVDCLKMQFDACLLAEAEAGRARLRGLVDRAGADGFVLCRIETAEALALGRSAGVELFQGRYVERLLAEERRRRQASRWTPRQSRG
jgi:EAL domain-containing protein (putative c-di-GMP-specific phosphodiesterase class I)